MNLRAVLASGAFLLSLAIAACSGSGSQSQLLVADRVSHLGLNPNDAGISSSTIVAVEDQRAPRERFINLLPAVTQNVRYSVVKTVDHAGQLQTLFHSKIPSSVGMQSGYVVFDGARQPTLSLPPNSPAPSPTGTSTAGPNGYNELYAPTMHDYGNCLELGVGYYRYWNQPSTPSQTEIFVYDGCKPGFVKNLLVPQPMLSPYLSSTGISGYYTMIGRVLRTPQKQDIAALYNSTTGAYDPLFSRASGTPVAPFNTEGWIMFETHYDDGPCSTLSPDPTFESDVQSYLTVTTPAPGSTATPQYNAVQLASPYPTQTSAAGACLQDDKSGLGAYYNWSYWSPSLWIVQSHT